MPALIEALGDRSRDLRMNAAVALRDLDARQAVPALEPATDDPDSHVRHAAKKTLWKFAEREDGEGGGIGELAPSATNEARRNRYVPRLGLPIVLMVRYMKEEVLNKGKEAVKR